MQFQIYSSIDELPSQFEPLFQEGEEASIFQSRTWLSTAAKYSGGNGKICIVGVEDGSPMALLLASQKRGGLLTINTLVGLGGNQTFLPSLIVSRDTSDPRRVFKELARGLRSIGIHRIEIELLREDVFCVKDLVSGFRDAGLMACAKIHDLNHYASITPGNHARFMKRSTKRRMVKLKRSYDIRFDCITTLSDTVAAWSDYLTVWDKSWKEPDIAADFVKEIAVKAAEKGWLRLQIMYADNTPVATEYVFVKEGIASGFKAAYDASYGKYSVGSINLHAMIENVIEHDEVREYDLGPGDEPYKREVADQARNLWLVTAPNVFTFKGAIAYICMILANFARRVARRALTRFS